MKKPDLAWLNSAKEKLLPLLRRHRAGIVRAAERGGKPEVQDVLARLQVPLHRLHERLHVDRRGRRALARAQRRIAVGKRNVALVEIVHIALAVDQHRQRQHFQFQFRRKLRRQVAGRIRHDDVLTHSAP